MNKIISISFLASLLLFLISCSKENPGISVNKQDANVAQKSSVVNNPNKVNPTNAGSISGVLTPTPIKALIKAYNDHFVSEEVVMNMNGTFKINNLPADGYNLLINYVPSNGPDYKTFEVYKIVVVANQDTKLGLINLPQ